MSEGGVALSKDEIITKLDKRLQSEMNAAMTARGQRDELRCIARERKEWIDELENSLMEIRHCIHSNPKNTNEVLFRYGQINSECQRIWSNIKQHRKLYNEEYEDAVQERQEG